MGNVIEAVRTRKLLKNTFFSDVLNIPKSRNTENVINDKAEIWLKSNVSEINIPIIKISVVFFPDFVKFKILLAVKIKNKPVIASPVYWTAVVK